MKSAFVLIAGGCLLVLGCSTPKAAVSSVAKDNYLKAVCECVNSNGTTLESYAEGERKKQGLGDTEYFSTFKEELDAQGRAHWTYTQFLNDAAFMECAQPFFDLDRNMPKPSDEEITTWDQENRATYPICFLILQRLKGQAK